MEKVPMRCYVCDTLAQFFCKNIFTLTTKHSETPVYQFFEKFLGYNIDSENVEKIVCQDCLIKIDEYDLAFTTAQKIEKELTLLVNRTRNKYEIDSGRYMEKEIKPEYLDLDEMLDDYSEPMNKVEVAMCEQPVLLKCNVCDETFESLTQMKSHKHKKSTKKELKIDVTDDEDLIEDTSFEVGMNFEEVDEFSDDGDGSYDPKQRKSSSSKRKVKASTGPHKCAYDGCDKEFMAKTEFRIHTHSHREADKLVCYICGMTYKSKSALDVHVGMHQGLSPHECAICLKKFTQKGALARHMPIHTGERPYVCEKCGKQFLHYSSFHMHQLAHDNIRDKVCGICGMQLRSNSHLTRHMRTHSGEKPYECPQCNQKFAQRYNMMTHFKAHQGIHRVYNKTHVCPICDVSFQRKIKLNEHLANAHGTMIETNVNTVTNENCKFVKVQEVQGTDVSSTPIIEMGQLLAKSV